MRPMPGRQRRTACADCECLARVDGQGDSTDEHCEERDERQAGDEHGLPAPGIARGAPIQRHDAPYGEPGDEHVPADPAREPDAEVHELQRSRAVGRVGPIEHTRGEEETRFEDRDACRRQGESKVDLTSRDRQRRELRDERAGCDRMRQRQQRGAHRVHRPPDHVPALDCTCEEGARQEHRRKRERERPNRPRQLDDTDGARKDDRRGRACSTSRETTAEPIHGDGGHHGSQDRRQPYPDLRVVSLHDGLEQGEIPGASRVVGQGALDDVGERALRSRDGRRLADVERPVTERDEPEDERQCRGRAVAARGRARRMRALRRRSTRPSGRGCGPERSPGPRVAVESADARGLMRNPSTHRWWPAHGASRPSRSTSRQPACTPIEPTTLLGAGHPRTHSDFASSL